MTDNEDHTQVHATIRTTMRPSFTRAGAVPLAHSEMMSGCLRQVADYASPVSKPPFLDIRVDQQQTTSRRPNRLEMS